MGGHEDARLFGDGGEGVAGIGVQRGRGGGEAFGRGRGVETRLRERGGDGLARVLPQRRVEPDMGIGAVRVGRVGEQQVLGDRLGHGKDGFLGREFGEDVGELRFEVEAVVEEDICAREGEDVAARRAVAVWVHAGAHEGLHRVSAIMPVVATTFRGGAVSAAATPPDQASTAAARARMTRCTRISLTTQTLGC